MQNKTLVIMAAGLGSRYKGGIKQLAKIGPNDEILMDYSINDAKEAGFNKVVFIIRKAIDEEFKQVIGNRISKTIDVDYVYQELDDLPQPCSKGNREKPWGTVQAILCCKDVVNEPFCVINADDFYGSHAFQVAYDYLTTHQDEEGIYRYMMVGYRLENTLTDNGHVARGVCEMDAQGYLADIHERTHIEKRGNGAAYTEDEGKTWIPISGDATVSMNMWGFSESILGELQSRFSAFLEENLEKNPLKCEYFLPFVVDELLKEGRATVAVEKSQDKWFGVTYKEDKPMVMAAIQNLKDQGVYPAHLWK